MGNQLTASHLEGGKVVDARRLDDHVRPGEGDADQRTPEVAERRDLTRGRTSDEGDVAKALAELAIHLVGCRKCGGRASPAIAQPDCKLARKGVQGRYLQPWKRRERVRLKDN